MPPGSFLNYFNDAGLDDPRRYAGAANTSLSYLVRPGSDLVVRRFLDYDGESANKTRTDGTNVELAYGDGLVASNLRLFFKQVEYLNGEGAKQQPLISSTLSTTTAVKSAGWAWLAAAGQYRRMVIKRAHQLHRSERARRPRPQRQRYAKAGARLRLSRKITANAGWRIDERDTEDRRVSNSNGLKTAA